MTYALTTINPSCMISHSLPGLPILIPNTSTVKVTDNYRETLSLTLSLTSVTLVWGYHWYLSFFGHPEKQIQTSSPIRNNHCLRYGS